MKFDFSDFPLSNRAFSSRPLTFCEPAAMHDLGAAIELVMIESGNRRAREHWQTTQLCNLLAHASQRSAFWNRRLGNKKINDIRLSSLPVLTRDTVREQVECEGSLLRAHDPIKVASHTTSGSSGTPIKFFVAEPNARYNGLRSLAQYLLEGRDLSLNRTRLKAGLDPLPNGVHVTKSDSWLGELAALVRCGFDRQIEFFRPDMKFLRKALEAHPIGYLVAMPLAIEMLLPHMDGRALKRAGTSMYISIGEPVDPKLRQALDQAGIPIRATYSAEEVGLIAMECEKNPSCYHVATSNVIVELAKDEQHRLGDRRLGRVLVTHLHSYATPFIRYDIGDLASLTERCVCGHDGPTLSNIYGRSKSLLKGPGGELREFFVRAFELMGIAPFDEFRIRQTALDKLSVEVARGTPLSKDESDAFRDFIERRAGQGIAVEVRSVAKIEWGEDRKRLGFRSDVV